MIQAYLLTILKAMKLILMSTAIKAKKQNLIIDLLKMAQRVLKD